MIESVRCPYCGSLNVNHYKAVAEGHANSGRHFGAAGISGLMSVVLCKFFMLHVDGQQPRHDNPSENAEYHCHSCGKSFSTN